MGDVALLAAELGTTVAGIDADARAVGRARRRAAESGVADRVEFVHADVYTFRSTDTFDAVVGRYILPHVVHPAALIRHVAQLVRAGGVIVLHEVDFSAPPPTWPHAPLEDHTYRLLGDSFGMLDRWPDAGKRLSRIFLDAGLPRPTVGRTCRSAPHAARTCMTGSPKRCGVCYR